MRPAAGSTREPTAAPPATSAQRAGAWGLVALWAALVTGLGGESFAAPATAHFLDPLFSWLWPELAPERLALLQKAVRKLAHGVEYGVLAALAFRATRLSGVARPVRAAAVSLALAAAVAAGDEARQAGLPSRSGSLADVALDLAGAGAALVLCVIAVRPRPPTPLEGA